MKAVSMERIKVFSLPVFMFLVLISTKMDCQMITRPLRPLPPPTPPRPLCTSQFNLVNYACAQLPYSPAPPLPPPPSTPLPPDNSDSSHRHRHRHRHRRHHNTRETPEESNCCRWLKEVDNECVCELLVQLPIFLARPVHEYTVLVDDSCNVTYTCSGRIRLT